MTTPTLVAAALSTRSWRMALQRHVRDHEADLVVELVRDRFQALAEAVDIVVVDDDTSWLSAPAVTSLTEAGKRVVGLYDPAESDGYGQRFLRELGVSLVVPADLPVEALVAFLRQHRPDRCQAMDDRAALELHDDTVPRHKRRILAVGGPAGAGSTAVAIGLSQLLAGEPTILVETDENHPGLARRLGLAIHPHVVTAVDAVRRAGSSAAGTEDLAVEDCLARPVLGQEAPAFDVVVGLASRDDWSLLRADDALALLEHLSRHWTHVVAKVGSCLEDLPATPRYEVSRQVIGRADRIVGVGDASPIGLLHFVDWLVDAVPLCGNAPIDVVLNRAPSNPADRGQLHRELREIAGDRLSEVIFTPPDRRVGRAGWDATTIANGPFFRRLETIAGTPTGRWPWRRRVCAPDIGAVERAS